MRFQTSYIKPFSLPGFLSHKLFYPEFTLFIRAVRHLGIITPLGTRKGKNGLAVVAGRTLICSIFTLSSPDSPIM